MKPRRKVLMWFVTATTIGIAVAAQHCYLSGLEMRRQKAELQWLLNTKEEPLDFMIRSIKVGMSRSEVQNIVVGYREYRHYPSGPERDALLGVVKLAEGPTDCYSYYFGLSPTQFLGHLRVCVEYDSDRKAKRAFKDYR